jgi:hypothetical protein
MANVVSPKTRIASSPIYSLTDSHYSIEINWNELLANRRYNISRITPTTETTNLDMPPRYEDYILKNTTTFNMDMQAKPPPNYEDL